jgi:hypothetical protein
MRNLTLTNIFVILIIALVIFLKDSFNADAKVIEVGLNGNIHDKELIARQAPAKPSVINCFFYSEGLIHKSSFSDGLPENSIAVQVTADCTDVDEPVTGTLSKHVFEKFVDNQWVSMNSNQRALGYKGKASTKNIGSIIVESYLFSADPSECLKAPKTGLLAKITVCMSFSAPSYNLPKEPDCGSTENLVIGCPPNEQKPPPTPPTPTPPKLPDEDSDNNYDPECYNYNTTSTTTSFSSSTSSPLPLKCKYPTSSSPTSFSFFSFSFLLSFLLFLPFVFYLI